MVRIKTNGSPVLREARIKLGKMLDNCRSCQLPPQMSGKDPKYTTVRHNWCMANCDLPGKMKKQAEEIERLQRIDRAKRKVRPEVAEQAPALNLQSVVRWILQSIMIRPQLQCTRLIIQKQSITVNWDVVPLKATKGQPVALCWLSPDCKHFSKAKGGKPKEKHIRGLAWVAVRWAATVRPRVIMLENVEEFKTWGPLLKDGTPNPDRKGRTFQAFVNALKRQGYKVDWRELRACDYGAPTIRKRFFLIARCDGKPIVWPKPTHGDPESAEVKSGKLKPWRTAAEIIDWSLPCKSIFERERPLAENTLRRIARGIQRFVIENPKPFIIKVNHHGADFRGQKIDEPLQTITAKNGWGIVAPFLAQYHTETAKSDARGQLLDRPILTLDTSNRYGLVAAFLARHFGESVGHPLEASAGTVTAGDGGKSALVTSHLIKMRGTNIGHQVTEPLHTITAGGNHLGEVRAFLMAYYGTSIGSKCDEPLHTITTKDRFGLVTVHGQEYQIVDIGMRMLEPHELFAAQGFPKNYIIDRDADGKQYPKSAQVARCGNAVPPVFAEHLVRSNIPEMCTGAGNALSFERYADTIGQLQLSL